MQLLISYISTPIHFSYLFALQAHLYHTHLCTLTGQTLYSYFNRVVTVTVILFTDGHHKLIRWRFVTHCAIDGYSRLIVFVKCSENNRASTMYDLFLKGIRKYGLPSRIRCDQGRENVQVVQHMLHHRGVDRRSALVGRPEPNMLLFFLPIMLFGNAQFFTDYAQNYARLCQLILQESLYNNIN